MIEIDYGSKATCDNCGTFKLFNVLKSPFAVNTIKDGIVFELERTGWKIEGDKHYCCEPCFKSGHYGIASVDNGDRLGEFLERLTELVDEFKKREAE